MFLFAEDAVRWMIGVAAFLAPVVIVMSAVAQAPGSGAVQTGAALLVDRIALTIEAPRGAPAAIR